MPRSVSSRVVLKNGVWSTSFRYSICCSDVSDANEPAGGMPFAKGRLERGELRAIVAGELRQKRRECAVDEVHDACLARAGRVVGRNDLRGDGFDVRGFGRAEKRNLRARLPARRHAPRPPPVRSPPSAKGMAAAAIVAAMACRSDRREIVALSISPKPRRTRSYRIGTASVPAIACGRRSATDVNPRALVAATCSQRSIGGLSIDTEPAARLQSAEEQVPQRQRHRPHRGVVERVRRHAVERPQPDARSHRGQRNDTEGHPPGATHRRRRLRRYSKNTTIARANANATGSMVVIRLDSRPGNLAVS